MHRSVAIFALEGSPFGARLAAAVGERGCIGHLLSLDAPLRGLPVTIGPGRIDWEGVDLLEAGAIFLELPLYCWPQPQQIDEVPAESEARVRFFAADREARSVASSALHLAAESVPVVNRPEASSYAAAPATALDDLERAGLPIHAWTLKPAPGPDAGEGFVILDAAGREHWHRPSRPPEGDLSLILGPVEGAVTSLLVIGGEVVGGIRYPSAAAWAAGRGEPARVSGEDPSRGLARRAASRLALEVVAATVAGGPRGPSLLHVEAGPDLAGWDDACGGLIVGALARRLVTLADRDAGETG